MSIQPVMVPHYFHGGLVDPNELMFIRPPRNMMEVKPARAFDSIFICFSFPELGVEIDAV